MAIVCIYDFVVATVCIYLVRVKTTYVYFVVKKLLFLQAFSHICYSYNFHIFMLFAVALSHVVLLPARCELVCFLLCS